VPAVVVCSHAANRSAMAEDLAVVFLRRGSADATPGTDSLRDATSRAELFPTSELTLVLALLLALTTTACLASRRSAGGRLHFDCAQHLNKESV